MTITAEATRRTATGRAPSPTVEGWETAVDLTPVAASDAVGRYTGLARHRPPRPLPFWVSSGVVGLIAIIAATAAPAIADLLTAAG